MGCCFTWRLVNPFWGGNIGADTWVKWGGEWISGQGSSQCSSLREEPACPREEQPCQEADVDTGDRGWGSGGGVVNEMRGGSAGSWRTWALSVGSWIRVYKTVHVKCLTYGCSQLSCTNDSLRPTICQTPCCARQQRRVSHTPLPSNDLVPFPSSIPNS